jgi:hypothetical protein
MSTKVDWGSGQLRLKLLPYGRPGSGKTWFAASAVKCGDTSPALMLSAAGNPESIRTWTGVKPDTHVIRDLKDLNPFYDFFAAGQPKEAVKTIERLGIDPAVLPYRCLIVDGMTELQRYSLAIAGKFEGLGPGDIGRQLQIQEFNPVLEHTTRMARLFFGLADPDAKFPVHVIVTSLEWDKLDMKTQNTTTKPLLWGSGGEEVGGYALAIGRIRMGSAVSKAVFKTIPGADVRRPVIFWRAQPGVVAKDQYNCLGDYMADPSIQKVVDLVYHGKGEGTLQTAFVDDAETNNTQGAT